MEQGPIEKLNYLDLVDEKRYSINTNIISAYVSTAFIIIYAVSYGIWFKVQDIPIKVEQLTKVSLLLVLGTFGFGLAMLKSKKLIFSSLYFNILIISFSVLTFFLVNKMVSQLRLKTENSFTSIIPTRSVIKVLPTNKYNYEATFNQAIKCALCSIISFSCMVGYGGIFELYLFSLFTPIGYELTRQVSIKYFAFDLGTIKIFVYGSIQGLISLVGLSQFKKRVSLNPHNLTIKHPNLKHNEQSSVLVLIGGIVLMLFFPLLAHQSYIFYTNRLGDQQDIFGSIFFIYLTMATSVLLSFSSSKILNKNFEVLKDYHSILIDSILCSGILSLNSSLYISKAFFSCLLGVISFIIVLFIHELRKNVEGNLKKVLLHERCTLFLAASIIGICIEQIGKAIMKRDMEVKLFNILMSQNQAFISLGMFIFTGLVFGLFFFSIINCCIYRFQDDLYSDSFSWHTTKQQRCKAVDEKKSENSPQIKGQCTIEEENQNQNNLDQDQPIYLKTPQKNFLAQKSNKSSKKSNSKSKQGSSKDKYNPPPKTQNQELQQTKKTFVQDFDQKVQDQS